MRNIENLVYGGILVECCVVENPFNHHASAIGIRYITDFGFHFIVTAPIQYHKAYDLDTLDKSYEVKKFIVDPVEVQFYRMYFEKTFCSEYYLGERVLHYVRNLIN